MDLNQDDIGEGDFLGFSCDAKIRVESELRNSLDFQRFMNLTMPKMTFRHLPWHWI